MARPRSDSPKRTENAGRRNRPVPERGNDNRDLDATENAPYEGGTYGPYGARGRDRDDRDYLWAYIRHLRRKLEPDPDHPTHIHSEPGFGYVLDFPATGA